MNERDFENYYCDDDAFDLAVDFHDDRDFYPVMFAGFTNDDRDEIFYITRGSADYNLDCYTISTETIEQYGTVHNAYEYDEPLYTLFYADDLDEITEELGLQ